MVPSRPGDREATSGRLWWRDGVVYQIYPRSFQDSNGDGIGDLEGIRRRLDHLAWLGVDAIWLSPCFPSPQKDFGYDVADYCDIDPQFGTLADFDRLLADSHARGIRVVLDWVPNHTSDQHPWFLESRRSRESPKRDWYVWRDPRPDGSPPNNWQAIFGGPAWERDGATGQYYLRSFLKEQADVNWRCPALVEAMHDVLRFWLDRGVDGFRIDVIHRILKDPALRDNPVIPGREDRGYGSQEHVHDENHPEVHAALREIRRTFDAYDERCSIGEVYLLDPEAVAGYYGDGDELHLAFNFKLTHAPWDASVFRQETARSSIAWCPSAAGPRWCWAATTRPRHASRYDHPRWGDARARLLATFLLTARGTPFLYYGEEIGMRNVPIPEDRLQDPLAWTLHPNVSRDPERTPMQWEPGDGAGFSEAEPWLPLGDCARTNVAAQRADPDSLLWHYRNLLTLRRETPALVRGRFATLEAPDGVLAYERIHAGQRARVALNFGDGDVAVPLGTGTASAGLHSAPGRALPADLSRVALGPCEGVVVIQG